MTRSRGQELVQSLGDQTAFSNLTRHQDEAVEDTLAQSDDSRSLPAGRLLPLHRTGVPGLAARSEGRERPGRRDHRAQAYDLPGARRHDGRSTVLEYAQFQDDQLFMVGVKMADTNLPFGQARLDALSRTFLGVPKSDALTSDEKSEMQCTFQERPEDAYGYATVDVVNTLLVDEQMRARHHATYQMFGFPEESIPPMRPTSGARVSNFLVQATHTTTTGSDRLASITAVRQLMRESGPDLFDRHPDASQFGPQTAQLHGGLIYSRTPTRNWHEMPGQLRDVDMAGCYPNIISNISVYWGGGPWCSSQGTIT